MRDRSQNSKYEFVPNVISGLISGFGSSTVTHPLNVASHEAIVNKRPFMAAENFVTPFQGIKAAMGLGPVLSAEYFILQEMSRTHLGKMLEEKFGISTQVAISISGGAAGSVHGLLANSAMAIQRGTWTTNSGVNLSFPQSAKNMWVEGGIKPFFRGASMGLTTGILFSSVYQTVRAGLNDRFPKSEGLPSLQFANSFAAAVTGGVAVAPLNYVRVIQQATKASEKSLSTKDVLQQLGREVFSQKINNVKKVSYLASRINLGPNAFRVAFGLAMGQLLFDTTKELATTYMTGLDCDEQQCPGLVRKS